MTTRPSTVARLGLAALGLTLLASAIPAVALDRTSDAGQRAVKSLIQNRMSRNASVVFQTTQSRNSGSDTLVTGRGYAKRGNGRGANSRDFTYSATVERSGTRTRNVSVRFSNGEVYSDNGSSNGDDRNDARRPTITKPESNFTDRDGDVTFEGRSEARNVTLTITDRSGANRTVTTRRVDVRDGRWSTNVRLNGGSYRARVTNDGRAEFDRSNTVDFRVEGNGSGNDERASFDRPENNFRDTDGEIRFSGDSEGRQVELKIYRDGREVSSRRIDVRDDRWDVTLRLDDGNYRATIRTIDGRGTAAVRFSVDRSR